MEALNGSDVVVSVGFAVGWFVGLRVGLLVGFADGIMVGYVVGCWELIAGASAWCYGYN